MSLKENIENRLGEDYKVFVDTNFTVQFDSCTKIVVTHAYSNFEVTVMLNNAVEQSEDDMANIVEDIVATTGVVNETFEE